MLSQNVLVLNRSWIAVDITNLRRALTLLYLRLAKVVTEEYETYDFDSWAELSLAAHMTEDHGLYVRTVSGQLKAPEVIVLSGYNGFPPKRVKFSRRNIFSRDKYTCQFCGSKPRRDDMTIDHIVPRSRGGRSTWENVVLACTSCNKRKGDRLPSEAGMRPIRIPKRPHWLNFLARSHAGSSYHRSWQRFVDTAYWNVELDEE